MNTKTRISLVRPDDWHLHIRDSEAMAAVVPHTARQFARAIIMPNLKPPISSTEMALAYRERILACIPEQYSFTPLMTLYLTENTDKDEIKRARESEHIYGAKLYPAGATTHSDAGVTDVKNIYPVLAAMEKFGLPLLVHGESTDPEVDVFDREKVFIERDLIPVIEKFQELKVVLEHITTSDAVEFVSGAREGVAATVTAHHLLMNRNEIFRGGIRPHNYCLPVLKREQHRQALLAAAANGNSKFFLGTDSAPHPKSAKESACGCAGIYTAHAAIELYAEAFEQAGALDKLESFASFHGPDFYGLPRNTGSITLERESWLVPSEYSLGDDTVVPLRANEEIHWKIV